MDASVKKRLIGAVVLAALALIFIPMLLKNPDVRSPDSADVPLEIPEEADEDGIKTIDIPLDGPVQVLDAGVSQAPASVSRPAGEPVSGNPQPPAETGTENEAVPADALSAAAGEFAVVIAVAGDGQAQAVLKGLKQLGLPATIQSNGSRFRVRVGPYASRALAEQARLRTTGVASGGTVVAMDAVPVPAKTEAVPDTPPASGTPASKPALDAQAAAPKPASDAAAKGFVVQIGAPGSEQAAVALRDKARAAGFNSFIQPVETASGRRYRVRIGPENSREAAQALLASVRQKTGIDGIVMPHP